MTEKHYIKKAYLSGSIQKNWVIFKAFPCLIYKHSIKKETYVKYLFSELPFKL